MAETENPHSDTQKPNVYQDVTPPTQIREVIEKTILKNKPVTYISTKDLTNTIDELTALLIAEYKQLLTELPEFAGEVDASGRFWIDREGLGFNEALDQCRAIIQSKLEGLSHRMADDTVKDTTSAPAKIEELDA